MKAHGIEYPATVFKHDNRHPNACIVRYKEPRGGVDFSWVPIKWIKPVTAVKVRPWYRDAFGKGRK